jgi:hypothetical protein
MESFHKVIPEENIMTLSGVEKPKIRVCISEKR